MSTKDFKIIQATLRVMRKKYITPHYIRVWLTGENIDDFSDTVVGEHNKILIPRKGVNEIHFPRFDTEKRRWIQPDESVRPTIRTFTHRGIDLNTKEIWIDFAVHGNESPASSWAIRATKGSLLGVMMKSGEGQLFPLVKNYLLVADATGIPVVSVILENLPKGSKGTCIIEVYGAEDVQEISTRAAVDFQWIFNSTPGQNSGLAAAVKKLVLPEQDRYAYIAAEQQTVKELREYLRKEKSYTRDELEAYAYWKMGSSE